MGYISGVKQAMRERVDVQNQMDRARQEQENLQAKKELEALKEHNRILEEKKKIADEIEAEKQKQKELKPKTLYSKVSAQVVCGLGDLKKDMDAHRNDRLAKKAKGIDWSFQQDEVLPEVPVLKVTDTPPPNPSGHKIKRRITIEEE